MRRCRVLREKRSKAEMCMIVALGLYSRAWYIIETLQ